MNDDLYLDTPIDRLIKWADKDAVATENGELGALACDAYEEYLELRTTNDTMLVALKDLLDHLWDDRKRNVKKNYSLMVAEVSAREAIRKGRENR